MPQLRAPAGPLGAVVITAAIGASAIGVLAALGRADASAAGAAAILVLVAGAAAGWWVQHQVQRAAELAAAAARPAHQGAPPYASLIDALPDPLLLITADEPDDLTGRRYILVNTAARDLLRIQSETGLLVTAIRDPDVL